MIIVKSSIKAAAVAQFFFFSFQAGFYSSQAYVHMPVAYTVQRMNAGIQQYPGVVAMTRRTVHRVQAVRNK